MIKSRSGPAFAAINDMANDGLISGWLWNQFLYSKENRRLNRALGLWRINKMNDKNLQSIPFGLLQW